MTPLQSQTGLPSVDHSGLPSFAKGRLLMLELYLDESENYHRKDPRQRPILFMAGYVADAEQWKEFSAEWTRVLADCKIPYFHAKDLKSGNAKLYRHLSFGQRRSLVFDLARLVAKYSLMGVGTFVKPSDYKTVTSQSFRNKYGSVYGLCVNTLLLMLSNVLISKTTEPERIGVYIEDGHKNAEEALLRVHAYKKRTEPSEWPENATVIVDAPNSLRKGFMRIGEQSLVSKEQANPVQAADLIAYLLGTATHPVSQEGAILEGVGDFLVKNKPHLFRSWTIAELSGYVQGLEQTAAEALVHNQGLHALRRLLRSYDLRVEKFPHGFVADARALTEEQWERVRKTIEKRQN